MNMKQTRNLQFSEAKKVTSRQVGIGRYNEVLDLEPEVHWES